jgi:hypothetical protein
MAAPRTYGNKLGRIEQVEIELVFVLLGDDLDTEVPLGESAGLYSQKNFTHAQLSSTRYIRYERVRLFDDSRR